MIRFCKTRLSLAMGFNPPGDFCWIKHCQSICDSYNSGPVPGSTIPRNQVTKESYGDLLAQLKGTNDPWMAQNVGTSTNFSPWMQKKLFKFHLGQKVLVARASDYTQRSQQNKEGGSWFKRSVHGAWSPVVRTVTELWLKDSHFYLSTCYSVSGIPNAKFYEQDLLAADFAE
jgi:hypothetical protein